jgi:hypothetical protein
MQSESMMGKIINDDDKLGTHTNLHQIFKKWIRKKCKTEKETYLTVGKIQDVLYGMG